MNGASSISDAELVKNLQSGYSLNESVRGLYTNYFDSLSHYILANNGNMQDAEDIFQEVVVNFIELVRKNKYRGEASVKTLLYAMNKNTWLNELKKRGRAANRERNYDSTKPDAEADVSQVMMDLEITSELMAIVNKLGEACKKVLLLFYYENFSIREILDNTEYENEQVVRNKKYKCLKQLEQLIMEEKNSVDAFKYLFNG